MNNGFKFWVEHPEYQKVLQEIWDPPNNSTDFNTTLSTPWADYGTAKVNLWQQTSFKVRGSSIFAAILTEH